MGYHNNRWEERRFFKNSTKCGGYFGGFGVGGSRFWVKIENVFVILNVIVIKVCFLNILN
jgi:hypothetical protein